MFNKTGALPPRNAMKMLGSDLNDNYETKTETDSKDALSNEIKDYND